MKTKILGLDVSSKTIGWGIVEIDGYNISLLKSGYVQPIQKGTILECLSDTRDKIKNILDIEKPDYIGIEDLIKFMPQSTATTVTKLSAFNRMIGLLAYDYLSSHPGLFNVMSIRHALKTGKTLPIKEEMPALVAKHLGFTFSFIKDKKGRVIEENYDVADGIAVALYYAFILTGRVKIKNKVAKPRKKKKAKKK